MAANLPGGGPPVQGFVPPRPAPAPPPERLSVPARPPAEVPPQPVPEYRAPPTAAPPSFQGGELDQPTPSQTWLAEQQNYFGSDPNNPQRTGQVFEDYDYNTPSEAENIFGTDPGLDTYYENEFKRGNEALMNQFRRSGFGGSAHLDALGLFGSELSADKAFREADFRQGQARDADAGKTNRYDMAGSLAVGADSSDLGFDRLGLDKRRAGTDAAGKASDTRLDSLMAAYDMDSRTAQMLLDALGPDTFSEIFAADDVTLEGDIQGEVSGANVDANAAASSEASRDQTISDLIRLGGTVGDRKKKDEEP